MARVAEDENGLPVVEYVKPDQLEDTILQTAHRRLKYFLSPDCDGRSDVGRLAPDGQVEDDWFGSLVAACGSTWNGYGDWHWRRGREQK